MDQHLAGCRQHDRRGNFPDACGDGIFWWHWFLGWVFSAIGSFFQPKYSATSVNLTRASQAAHMLIPVQVLAILPAFLVAWGYCLAICCASTAIVVSFVSAMSVFFPALSVKPGCRRANRANCDMVHHLGQYTRDSHIRKISAGYDDTKLVPLLLIAIGGLFFIKAANFHPFNLSGKPTFDAITTTAAMTMFAFVGIECATIPAGSIENSGKTVAAQPCSECWW